MVTRNSIDTVSLPNSIGAANTFLISNGTNYINSTEILNLGGNLTTSGAFSTTLTVTAATTVTLPTSGTLATTSQLPSIIATQFDVLVGGLANAIVSVGPGLAGQVLQSGGNAANPAYSTATYPSASGGAGKILISDGTNIIYSTPTYPNASATAGKIVISDGTNFVASTPTYPNASATAGKVIVSDGTNFVASTPTFPNASATSGKFIRSDGTNWVASTPTLPLTSGASGTTLISDGTNWITSGSLTATGFATWGGAGNYFDASTLGSFTVLRPGTGYINNIPISWTAPQTVSGLTAGNTYLIYIDSSGTLQKATPPATSTLTNNIGLFNILRDSTSPTNVQYVVKENHPYTMPGSVYGYLDAVVGTVVENENQGANITLNGTQKIQINGADFLDDNGLQTAIPDSGGIAVTWNKMYTNAGGKWATQNTSDTFSGFYNNAGTPTALGASKFGVYTLYVSKDNLTSSTPVYFAVLDTTQYNNQSAANAAIAAGTTARATGELAEMEIAQLGFITYSQSSNAISNVIISKSTLRSTVSTSSATPILTTQFDVLVGGPSNTIVSVGPGSTGQVLQSGGNAANPAYSTATYPATATATGTFLRADGTNWVASTPTLPATAGTAGKILISDGTNFISSTPTYPNASATLNKHLKSDGTNFVASTVTYPDAAVTAGKVIVSDGSNYIASTPTFPNASATSGKIIKSDGTNWLASTETYAAPGTSGNVLTSDGTNWTSAAPSASTASSIANKTVDFVDDFLYGFNGTLPGAVPVNGVFGPWWTTFSGTSAGVFLQGNDVTNSHPGLVDLTTGSTNAGTVTVTQFGANANFVLGGGVLTITFYFTIPTLSTSGERYSIIIGMTNASSTAFNAGIWVSYSDSVNSGRWVFNTEQGGTPTNSNSSTAVGTGFQVIQIQVNAAASSVAFFAGTTLAGLASLGTAITTNIPTGKIAPFFNITKTVGTTARHLEMDLVTINQVLTTAR